MDDVRAMIALAMRSGLDSSVLDDFVASIDWSAHDSSVPAVREALGRIEGWSTAYHEGDMSVGEYAMSLIAETAKEKF